MELGHQVWLAGTSGRVQSQRTLIEQELKQNFTELIS
ncbi:hypothetical protein V3C99_010234, partial [Haemonchus contortus]